jgi:hypothetical protein
VIIRNVGTELSKMMLGEQSNVRDPCRVDRELYPEKSVVEAAHESNAHDMMPRQTDAFVTHDMMIM